MAAGATASLDFTETVDAPSATESDSTTASATSDQSTTVVTSSAAVGVVPASDLTVAVTDGTDSIAAGSSDTYTVTVTNDGPSAVTNATVTDTFSTDVGALGGSSSLPGASFTDLGGGQADWTGVSLANGAAATFLVGATLPPALGPGSTLVNVATVSVPPGQVDTAAPSDAVDSDTVTGGTGTGVLALSIATSDGSTFTAPPDESVPAAGDVTYQVTVANDSATPQDTLSVPVTLPGAFALHSGVTASVGVTTTGPGVLNWSIPSLAPGAAATLQYTETADAPASFEADSTQVSASVGGTVAGTASETIEVLPAAALSVSVDDGVTTTAPGSSLNYTVTVSNAGPSPAEDATVSEAFNGGFTALVGVSSIGGTSFTERELQRLHLDRGEPGQRGQCHLHPDGRRGDERRRRQRVRRRRHGHPVAGPDRPGYLVQRARRGRRARRTAGHRLLRPGQRRGRPVDHPVGDGWRVGSPRRLLGAPSSAAVCATGGVDGATLSFTAAGTCVVDADQLGNASFAAAPTVSASIVVDQAPGFTAATPPTTASVGQPYAYTFAASGSPAPTFTLANGAPSWLTLDAGTGALSGTPPAGTSSFTYSITAVNSVGTTSAGPFTVTVAQPADPGPPDVDGRLGLPERPGRRRRG